jgi:hypothetical protein
MVNGDIVRQCLRCGQDFVWPSASSGLQQARAQRSDALPGLSSTAKGRAGNARAVDV